MAFCYDLISNYSHFSFSAFFKFGSDFLELPIQSYLSKQCYNYCFSKWMHERIRACKFRDYSSCDLLNLLIVARFYFETNSNNTNTFSEKLGHETG